MRKKRSNILQTAGLFALLLFLCLPSRAAASNIDYSGELDPQTSEPVTEDNASETTYNTSGLVMISSSMYYDWSAHDFVYPVSNSLNEIHCSAADGMVVDKPVTLSTGSDSSIVVFLNGSEYTGELSSLSQPGEYVVSARQSGDIVRILSFTIVGETTNAVTPAGRLLSDGGDPGRPEHLFRPLQLPHGSGGPVPSRI